ncbi:MAG TPA: bifunctional riboflavin kinase/FAD synthetase [Bacteroidia bacterium]|nr:bifunctional riboflavin kinase/FAD synthetase [Bacteroidia bacterium]
MNIYNSIDEFAASGKTANVVTTGTFDGVHLGHQTILDKVCSIAKAKGTESVLLTFQPHPRQVLFPAPTPQVGDKGVMFFLTTLSERIELLEKAGIGNLIIHPFTKELSQVLAFDYVKGILVGKLKTETLVIGHDHHFGKDRKGSIKELEEWGPQFGFNVEEMPPLKLDAAAISSSKIRKALQGDDLQTANKYLGYHFFIHAKVIHGMKLGSTKLGYPTANLEMDFINKIVPADGIYAVYVYIEGSIYKGMMSIGANPTIENKGRSMEVHIFHFHKDIYGETIKVAFVQKIRNEEKFNNLEELKAKLDKDKEACLGIL